MKGHRGSYIATSTNNKFRDGWGTHSDVDDEDNHGWSVDLNGDGMAVVSYGRDGVEGALSDDPDDSSDPIDSYELDMAMSPQIVVDDWKTTVSSTTVRLVNMTGTKVDLSSLDLKVSLLIYINGDAHDDGNTTDEAAVLNSDGRYEAENSWRCVTSGQEEGIVLDDDGSVESPAASGNYVSAPMDMTFVLPTTEKIPVGEHLLVVVAAADGALDSAFAPRDFSSFTGRPSPHYVTARVKFYPRGGVPDMVLEIR